MTDRIFIAAIALVVIVVASIAVQTIVAARSTRRARSVTINAGSRVRLMLFSTPRCGDCQTQKQLIEQERGSFGRPVEVSHHDVLVEGDFARGFGIVTVPALVVAKQDGSISAVRHGLVEPDRLRSLIAMAG